MLSDYFVCSFFIRHILMLSKKKGKVGGDLASADISFSYGGYTVVQENDWERPFQEIPIVINGDKFERSGGWGKWVAVGWDKE